MTAGWLSERVQHWLIAGAMTVAAGVACTQIAVARSQYGAHHGTRGADRYTRTGEGRARQMMAGMGYHRWYSSGLQCVPFARDNSGIELSGNANTWWNNATGVYERGSRPEVGSVLNFRSSGRMRLGHVAVVSNVLDSRTVEVDHANWSSRGGVRRNVRVLDVSAYNDWSAVRVALGSGDFGSVYPTYGFIYDRPDRGTMVANAEIPVGRPALSLSAGPFDLRPAQEQVIGSVVTMPDEEVAEASDDTPVRGRRSAWHRSRSVRYAHTAVNNRNYSSQYSMPTVRIVGTHATYGSTYISARSHAGHGVVAVKHGRHRT